MENIKHFIIEKLKIDKNTKNKKIKVQTKVELKNIIEKRSKLDKNSINLNDVDISKLDNISRIFRDYSFKEIHIENWEVSNIKDMSFLFPISLEKIDLSNWNTCSLKKMTGMFYNCNNLKNIEGISDWEVSNVEDFKEVFAYCERLTNLDISNWDMKNAKNMVGMFKFCKSLETLKIPKTFNDYCKYNRSEIFFKCIKLKMN